MEENKELEFLVLPIDLVNGILQYLLKQPMGEVMGMVNDIQTKAKPLEDKEGKEDKKGK